MKEIIDFLNLIVENNNRPWFQQHKDLYTNAQNKFNAIAEQILIGVQEFDPHLTFGKHILLRRAISLRLGNRLSFCHKGNKCGQKY